MEAAHHTPLSGNSRRLADFLFYSQRYRIGIVALSVIWYLGIALLDLGMESGERGTNFIGILLGLNLLIVLVIPHAATRHLRRHAHADAPAGSPRST